MDVSFQCMTKSPQIKKKKEKKLKKLKKKEWNRNGGQRKCQMSGQISVAISYINQ